MLDLSSSYFCALRSLILTLSFLICCPNFYLLILKKPIYCEVLEKIRILNAKKCKVHVWVGKLLLEKELLKKSN